MDVLVIRNDQDLIFSPKSREKKSDLALSRVKSKLVSNPKLLKFISRYFDGSADNYLTSTSDQVKLENLRNNEFSSILNLKRVNDIRYINKFFETVNSILPHSGLYLGKVITYPNRRAAILKKYPPVLNRLIYSCDYLLFRVVPKLPILKRIYFYLTKGKGRVMSRAEMYGRLYACGFEIIDDKSVNHALYFVAKKIKPPSYDKNPTYAPLITLNRIGKWHKI